MDTPEPLDAHRVWFRMIRLHGKMSVAFGKRLRDINLSIPQCDVLCALMEREGVSQQDLAERLFVTKGNISGLIDRLASSELVERRKLKGDRRTHAIYLTDKGRNLGEQGFVLQRAFVEQVLGRLDHVQLARMDALLTLTGNILTQAEAEDPAADPK